MQNSDNLFPNTVAIYQMGGLPGTSYGGNYGGNGTTDLQKSRRISVVVEDCESEFYAQVCETAQLAAKPYAGVKSQRQRRMQMTRTAWASVAPLADYNTIADAVRDLAAKLHENYQARYKTQLDAPLEEIITAALQNDEAQPPNKN